MYDSRIKTEVSISTRDSVPTIKSREFKNLPWKDQLYVTALYLRSPDRYKELAGLFISDPSLLYLDDRIKTLRQELIPLPESKEDPPFSIIENYFAGYSMRYASFWYGDISPLDDYDIQHFSFFKYIQLVNFPLISFDYISVQILKWLTESEFGRDSAELLYLMFRMRVVIEFFMPELLNLQNNNRAWKSVRFKKILTSSSDMLNGTLTIQGLNGDWPLMMDHDVLDWIDSGSFIMFNKVKLFKGRYYCPLIPADLPELSSDFRIRDWDLLTT